MGILMAAGTVFTGANPAYIPREPAYQLKKNGATHLICAGSSIDVDVQAAKLAGLRADQVFLVNVAIHGANKSSVPVDSFRQDCRYWADMIASKEEGSNLLGMNYPRPSWQTGVWH